MVASPEPGQPAALTEKITTFPAQNGVYLMKDARGHIIYVGKAKNLRQRVRQYFTEHDTRYQIRFLMARVADIDFIETHTESEALLLENSLIKKHQPRYNVFLKDDKTYLGLKLTMEHNFPRLIETRRIKKDGGLYYGPFTSAEGLREVKDFIYRHFQLRTCSDRDFALRSRPCLEYQIKRCTAPCVRYITQEDYAKQIEDVRLFLEGRNRDLKKIVTAQMLEAAGREDFEKAARLRDLLHNMELILEKQKVTQLSFDFVDLIAFERQAEKVGFAVLMVRDRQLIDSKYFVLTDSGDDAECLQNFITQYYSHDAFIPREIILPIALPAPEVLEKILSERAGRTILIKTQGKGKRRQLLELAHQNLASHFHKNTAEQKQITATLKELKARLRLNSSPRRIECFDVSHLGGTEAVASMVSCVEGQMRHDLYRHFIIRGEERQNDFAMMREVLRRRLSKNNQSWEHPDLLLIDGGKGQLAQALAVLKELRLPDMAVVAIAKGKGTGARAKGQWRGKKEEEIYLPGQKNPLKFKSGSAELKLLQHIRDESHRFAISFHRRRRDKHFITGQSPATKFPSSK